MVDGDLHRIHSLYKNKIIVIKKNQEKMMTILLIALGLACFWIFYKSIDLFEKI